MKTTRFRSFLAELEDMGHTCVRGLRSASRSISSLSWPALLLASIVLAFVISILPLALLLFVGLLACKYIAIAIFGERPRTLEE